MVKKGYLNIGNTLLSKGEADYFNYYLNKKEFSNGLDLRNIYAHGTPPTSEDSNAAVYQQHYITGLKLVILLLIKLNDEFCLRDEKAVNS